MKEDVKMKPAASVLRELYEAALKVVDIETNEGDTFVANSVQPPPSVVMSQ